MNPFKKETKAELEQIVREALLWVAPGVRELVRRDIEQATKKYYILKRQQMKTKKPDHIIAYIEQLAAEFPWDSVEITIKRNPEGKVRFQLYLPSNDQYGFDGAWGFGATYLDALANLRRDIHVKRDPNVAREMKIQELREQIAKLQAVVTGLPPYRPNRELAYYNEEAPISV